MYGGEIIMPEKQQSLIYIEQQNKTEAEFMSRSFVDKALKNRAYINALGAELVIKYLALEGVDATKSFNLHSISKILEKVDIADIRLPNVHIDVRVVFDENQIFIPKSHFEYGLVPDVYFVLKLAQDFKYVEFLGFVKPEVINKKNANSDYYFVDKNDLTSPDLAKEFIQNFEGNTSVGITQNEMLKGRELSILMADHNISDSEMKELFRLLSSSSELRDSVLEFDNFETLSNSVGTILFEQMTTPESADVSSIEDFLDNPEEEDQNSNEEETQQEEQVEAEVSNEPAEDIISDDTLTVDFDDVLSDETISSGDLDILEMDDSVVQDTDSTANKDNDHDELGQIVGDVVKKSLGFAAGAAAAGAVAGAAAEAAEISAAGFISEEAMKLAGVAGDTVSDLINQNIDNQEENLSKIDFENLAVRSENTLDELSGFELAEDSVNTTDEYAAPKDLSALEQISTPDFVETNEIHHEVVDLAQMDEVLNDNFKESTEDLSDLHNIPAMNSTDMINMDIEADNNNEHLSELDFQNLGTIDIEQDSNIDTNSEPEEENLIDLGSNEDIFNEEDLNMFDADLSMDVEQNELTDLSSEETIAEDSQIETEEPSVEEDIADNESELIMASEDEDMDLSEDINMLEDDLIIDDFDEDTALMEDSLEEDIPAPSEEIPQNITDSVEADEVEENNETNDLFIDEDLGSETSEDELFANIDMGDDLVLDDVVDEEDVMNNSVVEETRQQDNSIIESNTIEEDETVSFDEIEEPVVDTYETTDIDNSNLEEDNLASLDEIAEVNNSDEDFSASEDLSSQEWLEDSVENSETNEASIDMDIENVDNPDVEMGDIEVNEQTEDIITEPEVVQPYEFAVAENSVVISDLTFKVGEIPIDINNPDKQVFEGPEQLGDLYNENVPGGSLLQNPGTLGSAAASRGRKSPVGGILGGIVVLIILGVVGFYVAKMLKPAVEEAPEPITDGNTSVTPEVTQPDPNALNVNPENVVSMENNTPAVQPNVTPEQPAKPQVQQPAPQAAAAKTPAAIQRKPKQIPATSFLNVRKLSWEVPDYISYNQQFKQYFQSAGKSLKLSLTTDLLAASEYVYSDQVRVSILYDKDGTFKEAKILLSSGSAQVDKIVLQTVNQTLKVLKAPNSVGNDESTTVILKIYF